MVTDTDWDLLKKRLESIERSIEMLKAMQPIPQAPTPSKPADLTRATRPYGALGEIPCIFDTLLDSQLSTPLGLVCNCPKHSPYALSSGSLQDSGLPQIWRNKDD